MDNADRIETNYVGHHVSAGGFIFYEDKESGEVFTLLITNKKNELWLCKGHIEKDESHLEAAIREFDEEMGMKREMLTHIDFLTKLSYSFKEWGGENTKEVYVHVFESKDKYDLSGNTGVEDITKIEWYNIENALKEITFNQVELKNAVNVFKNHLQQKE